MNELDDLMGLNRPTADRPLAGVTVLAVEDSRFACEALRLMCQKSGARIRRADCLASARRHLRVYRPTVAMIDLGLPDGPGTELIHELCTATPRIPLVLGMSADLAGEEVAIAAGADAFLAKPIETLAAFQSLLLKHLPPSLRPVDHSDIHAFPVEPDLIAFHDDLAQIAPALSAQSDNATLDYAAQFIGGLARSARDTGLEQAAHALAKNRANGQSAQANVIRLADMVKRRLGEAQVI